MKSKKQLPEILKNKEVKLFEHIRTDIVYLPQDTETSSENDSDRILYEIMKKVFLPDIISRPEDKVEIIHSCHNINRYSYCVYDAPVNSREDICKCLKGGWVCLVVRTKIYRAKERFVLVICNYMIDTTGGCNIIPDVYKVDHIGEFVDAQNKFNIFGFSGNYQWVRALSENSDTKKDMDAIPYLINAEFTKKRWKLISILLYLRILAMEKIELLPENELTDIMSTITADVISAMGICSEYNISMCPCYLGIDDAYHPSSCDEHGIDCETCWKKALR